jgi:FkbM family methyltransferase
MTDHESDLLNLLSRLKHVETLVGEIRSLVGPFGTMFPDGTMLVQTIHGLKYFIDPNDEIMAPQLVVYRQWEPDLSRYISSSVTPDTVFVDVGANFGYFTCLAASKIGSNGGGRVISIEPNPAMQRLLKKNIRINWSMGKVEIHDCAITERTGYVDFCVPSGRAANASVATLSSSEEGHFIVPSKSLDELILHDKVDLMKIDVEGFETAVLRGGRGVIGRSNDIQIVLEWSVAQMKSAGFGVDELLQLLIEQRLSVYHLPPNRFIDEAEWRKLKIEAEALKEIQYDNLLLRRNL